ncbi:MAG: neutral/alkaline non-lysosomal ceramidase N-terminal domain-containing protein [Phycisphaeraceae bacterium]
MNTPKAWQVGAAQVDITPKESQFLFGYPHVDRYSTGVHDPLIAAAMFVGDGQTASLFVGGDAIFIPRDMAQRIRQRIAAEAGLPAEHVMVTASHTHSGPITVSMISNEGDPHVPAPDPTYVAQLEDGFVEAGVQACRNARPARLGYAVADGSGLGTNRRDPAGPSIPDVPVLVARDAADEALLAVMAVVSMHPTVLHEDWTQVSGDFPGLARQHLRQTLGDCPFVYHMGASGNQSPRHVTRANTIAEADRLGQMLSESIAAVIDKAKPVQPVQVKCVQRQVELPLRSFPPVNEARKQMDQAVHRLKQLRESHADRTEVRTAECDWFGAEETFALAQASEQGRLADAARACQPAEVQVIQIGEHAFVGWPGEVFVEFAIEVMGQYPNVHVITLANSDLQGYIVTQAAIDEGAYEAGNAIFASPASGERLVQATLNLLRS